MINETATPPAEEPVMKASDILAGALDYWGEGGEHWASGIWFGTHTACLYGGMLKAAYGPTYSYQHRPSPNKSYQNIGSNPKCYIDPVKEHAYKRAEKFVLDELEARGHLAPNGGNSIITFNDRTTAKLANEKLKKQGSPNPKGSFKAAKFAEVKDVVCHALKRAMDAGE